jgi:hypothetical protein
MTDEDVMRLPLYLGAVEQFVDSTDVLERNRRIARLRTMYKEER